MDEVSKDARDPARARHDGVWFDMWLSVVVNVNVSPVDEWALTPPTVSMLPAECCDLKIFWIGIRWKDFNCSGKNYYDCVMNEWVCKNDITQVGEGVADKPAALGMTIFFNKFSNIFQFILLWWKEC